MRIKTFTAASMPDAIRLVREELGDGGIIISSQRDGKGIRVTAAIEDDEHPVDDPAPPPVDQPLDAIEAIAQALDRHGTPGYLAERLLKAAEPLAERLARAASAMAVDAPVMTLAAALDTLFRFDPLAPTQSKPLVLMGPPGSGKTVTVAKLATRAVLANLAVGVITADTMRAGAVDQLGAFTRILELDLLTVQDRDSLADAIAATAASTGDGLLLIDTAGTNPFDPIAMAELEAMLDGLDLDRLLVLPAGTDTEEAAESARAFARLGCTRVLITRLDAARRLGSVLVAADVAGLGLCDFSVTPHVAEGLSAINPVSFAKLLLPEVPPATSVIAQMGARP
jgi:flagellar biosynthesis protein FlhF